jgi:hypothetical protein
VRLVHFYADVFILVFSGIIGGKEEGENKWQ